MFDEPGGSAIESIGRHAPRRRQIVVVNVA